jgi:hypothetical protein
MSDGQWIESATLDLWEGRHREQLNRIKELTELCALEYQRAWLLETQKNIAEEKLAQQDDLVQAAVAAALREAADYAGTLQDFGREEAIEAAILAFTTPDAQAALDRVVAAALKEAINRVSGCDRISEVQPAILALIRKGGE